MGSWLISGPKGGQEAPRQRRRRREHLGPRGRVMCPRPRLRPRSRQLGRRRRPRPHGRRRRPPPRPRGRGSRRGHAGCQLNARYCELTLCVCVCCCPRLGDVNVKKLKHGSSISILVEIKPTECSAGPAAPNPISTSGAGKVPDLPPPTVQIPPSQQAQLGLILSKTPAQQLGSRENPQRHNPRPPTGSSTQSTATAPDAV